jgi:hypothetical protein
MNRVQPLAYTGQRIAKLNALPADTALNVRNNRIREWNKQELKAREKIHLLEQAERLQHAHELSLKKQARQREKQRAIEAVELLNRQLEAKRILQAEAKRRGVEKRKATIERKKVMNNVVADISGTLRSFETQIQNPLIIACDRLRGQTHAYLQITKNGEEIISGIQQIEGKDGITIWWNNFFHMFLRPGGDSDPSESGIIRQGDTFHIVLIKANKIPSERIKQMFREGETHCVIEPLYLLWKKMADRSENESSKKRMYQIANKIKKMETVYPNGVPEDDMEIVAKVCRRCIILHDIIGNEIKRFNPSSTHQIHFTNTRENHIDVGHITLDAKYEMVNADEMAEIVESHKGQFYLFDGDIRNGIAQSLRSARGAWSVENPDRTLFNEFSKSQGIQHYGLNAIVYPELNQFVKEARIINSVPTPLCDEPNQTENVQHIDVEKAYTQHKYAPIYKGFLGHITNWTKLTCSVDFLKTHLGIFQFLVENNTSELFQKLGICKGKIYTLPSPEIEYFISLGVSIKLLAGCWGSRFDIEYSQEILQNRRYCIWAGKQGQDDPFNIYTITGNDIWASHLKAELGDENVLYFSSEKMIVIKLPKKSYSTRHHILAFITSYTRMNMIKMMQDVKGELIKVVLDGLYFRGVLPDIVIPHHNKELKQHVGFRDAWYHESTINTSSWSEYDSRFDGSAVLAGAGGSGKTHSVFNSKGLIRPLYVVPSHVLGRKMKTEYGGQYTTIHKFVGIDCRPFKEDHYEPHVVLIDELTMIEKNWIEKAITLYPNTMFLIAGDIDKNQWFQCRNGSPGNFSKIWIPSNWKYVQYDTDYRAKDEELKAFKLALRSEMKHIFTDGGSMDTFRMKLFLTEKYNCHSFDDAISQFTNGDTWIAGTHKTNEKLLARGIVSGYINSDKEIISSSSDTSLEQRGSFTIHSFQGLTINKGKVFISLDMFEYAMLYTAVSRCVNFNQVVLVK